MKTTNVMGRVTSQRLAIALIAIVSMLGAVFVFPGTAHATPVSVDSELNSGSQIVIGGSIVVPLDSPTNCDSNKLDFSYNDAVTPLTAGVGILDCTVNVTGPPDAQVDIDCIIVYEIDPTLTPDEVWAVHVVNCLVSITIPDLGVTDCLVSGAAAFLEPDESGPATIPGSGIYVDGDPAFPPVVAAGNCTAAAATLINTAVGLGVTMTLDFTFI